MTLREALDYGVHELRKAHTHDPEGSARFLLRHAFEKSNQGEESSIDLNRVLLTEPDFELSDQSRSLFAQMIDRRLRHEPVWYITNEAYFWKDVFLVDERVLIPRPETELLVENVLNEVKKKGRQVSVIDVGTGSGEIAISIARELSELSDTSESPGKSVERSDLTIPTWHVYASDISADAIEVAKLNARRLGVERYLTFLLGDALKPLKVPVDIIVGNPPYVPSGVVGGLSYDIHHFEPRVALDGGLDGLTVHRKILSHGRKLLKEGGSMFLEIGHDQGKITKKIASQYFPGVEIQILKDYSGQDRILSIQK